MQDHVDLRRQPLHKERAEKEISTDTEPRDLARRIFDGESRDGSLQRGYAFAEPRRIATETEHRLQRRDLLVTDHGAADATA